MCEPDISSIRLTEAMDLDRLRDPQKDGVVFEIERQDADFDLDEQKFEPEDVYHDMMAAHSINDDDESGDDDDGISPYERMAKKMTDITGDGGVLKKIVIPGAGSVVTKGCLVYTHYRGFQEYSDQPFDSTRLRNETKNFRLGRGDVLEGLDVAVATMKKGETSHFLIRPEYAFGKMGCPPRVPADATLKFEVELINFVEKEGIEDFFFLTEDERERLDFGQILKMCKSEKEEGTQFFNNRHYEKALKMYKRACEILERCHLRNKEEEDLQRPQLLKVYLNLALCCINLKRSALAITYSRKALDIDKNNVKALYRCGQALHQLSDFDRARHYLLRAQHQEPQNREIRNELKKLDNNVKRFTVMEKDMYKRMFSSSGKQTEKEEEEKSPKCTDRSLDCSDEFRKIVRERLVQFQNDPDLTESPFPPGQLTVAEIACIMEIAQELDLDPHMRGSGPNSHMVICKKRR